MTNFGLQPHLITKPGRRGKLKTYYGFNAFTSSPIYKTFAFHFPASWSRFPSCPVPPETLLHYLFYHDHVLFSLTSQHSTSICSRCPQNALTHHRTPLAWKYQERAGVQGNVLGVQRKAVARVNSPIEVGPFCSLCAFWHSCFLQDASWALQLKKKRAIKHMEPYHSHIMLMLPSHGGKVLTLFNCR